MEQSDYIYPKKAILNFTVNNQVVSSQTPGDNSFHLPIPKVTKEDLLDSISKLVCSKDIYIPYQDEYREEEIEVSFNVNYSIKITPEEYDNLVSAQVDNRIVDMVSIILQDNGLGSLDPESYLINLSKRLSIYK